MNRRRTIKPSLKDRVITCLMVWGICVGIVAACILLFGYVLPSLGSPESAEQTRRQITNLAQRLESFGLSWREEKPFAYVLMNSLTVVALGLMGLWGVYRALMYFADGLDREGFWNALIARRSSKRH